MANTLAGVYRDYKSVQAVFQELLACGFSTEDVQILPADEKLAERYSDDALPRSESLAEGIRDIFYKTFGGEHATYADKCADAVRRGQYVLTVNIASVDQGDQATQVMNRHDPVPLDERTPQGRGAVFAFQRPADDTADYSEQHYRRHFASAYGNSGERYEDYAQAYRHGFRLAREERYRGYRWSDAESTVRQDWESDHQRGPWERVKDAVRYGWEKVTR